MLQVFRRTESPERSVRLKLRGPEPGTRYAISSLDSPAKETVIGEEPMQTGFPVSINEQAGAAVYTYERVK